VVATSLPAETGTTRPATEPGSLPSLTGLRFLAALMVFGLHTSLSADPVPPNGPTNLFAAPGPQHAWETAFTRAGFVGVSFFFVLSGFVLTWSSRPGTPARSFWRRRLCKIFPNHIATWALAMVLFAAAITPLSRWLPNLLLVHTYRIDPLSWISVNSPSWSLCAEILFYALFPLLIGPVRRLREDRLWMWTGLAAAGVFAVVVVNQLWMPPPVSTAATGLPVSPEQFWLGYFFPPARMFEFVLGMLLARLIAAGRWPRIGVLPAAALLLGSYVLAVHLPFVWGFNAATVIPIALLIGAVSTADLRGTRTGLRNRTMTWLGEVSYAFYLTQGIVLLYGRTLFHFHQYSTPVAVLVLLAFLVANIAAASILYVGLERPVMRRFSRPRRRSADLADVRVGQRAQDVPVR
jgi:peptidoglycan/LPS O-acetylase OafA/YrhL